MGVIQEEKGGVGKDLVSLTSLGESPLRGQEGQEGGKPPPSFPLVDRRVSSRTRTSSCIFMPWPRHSAPQSQLMAAGRLLWGGLTAPASRHSTIVQNGIGPRKPGACENCYEFCKTAPRR